MPNMLNNLTVDEVSLVDSPANSEKVNGRKVARATVAFFKRDLSAVLWDSEDSVCKAVDGPDEGTRKSGKTHDGKEFPKSDFAYAPDDVPSHWKLRLTATPGGKPDAGIVGAAVAALGKGFRGKKVEIPVEALAGVKAKVRAAWTAANEGKDISAMPAILRKGETAMTIEQIEKKLAEQDVVIKSLKEDSDVAKAETETVIKMSKKERKLYASMDTEKRKAYMAADEGKRKEMMGACEKAKKEKAAEDSMDEAMRKRFRAAGPVEKAAMLAEVDKAEKKEEEKKKKDKPGAGDDEADHEEPDEDDLEKRELVTKLASTEDRIVKTEKELAAIKKQHRVVVFAKRAEQDLPHTPGTPEEKGEMLMKFADAFGGETSADFQKYMESAKAADAAFAVQFTEIGKGGASDIPALKVFDAAVEAVAKSEKISVAKATEKVMMERPDLYADYERDQRTYLRR